MGLLPPHRSNIATIRQRIKALTLRVTPPPHGVNIRAVRLDTVRHCLSQPLFDACAIECADLRKQSQRRHTCTRPHSHTPTNGNALSHLLKRLGLPSGRYYRTPGFGAAPSRSSAHHGRASLAAADSQDVALRTAPIHTRYRQGTARGKTVLNRQPYEFTHQEYPPGGSSAYGGANRAYPELRAHKQAQAASPPARHHFHSTKQKLGTHRCLAVVWRRSCS